MNKVRFLEEKKGINFTDKISCFDFNHCCIFLNLRVHDRKMCVLGLCVLIGTAGDRHQAITDNVQTIVPALLLLFEGLKRAYISRAEDEDSDDEEDDDDLEGTIYSIYIY